MDTKNARNLTAASAALLVRDAGQTLFENGGKQVLSEPTRAAVQQGLEQIAPKLVGQLGADGAKQLVQVGTTEVAKTAAKTATSTALKQVASSATRAGGLGFAIDGVISVYEGVQGVKSGELTRAQARRHVAREAASGAAASAGGVVAAAGIIAVTGGLAAPAVFAVGFLGSVGTKVALLKLF